MKCPCCSNKKYTLCCGPYHQGRLPPNALSLMRSRYSAYALDIPKYIVDTTHHKNPHYQKDTKAWIIDISSFAKQHKFSELEVVSFEEKGRRATVIFIAYLKQGSEQVTLKEKSLFIKEDGQWLYLNGQVY